MKRRTCWMLSACTAVLGMSAASFGADEGPLTLKGDSELTVGEGVLAVSEGRTDADVKGVLSLARPTMWMSEEPTGGGNSEAELAKKLNNPVADLISVPFQYNADFGIGPANASKSTLNIQPVIPVSISKDWNVIIRTIVPVIYAASPADGVSSNWGLGDTTQSFFFSPKAPTKEGWIWGVGPVFLWPTATDVSLGTGKWGAGPTAVLLKQEKGWTYGILANHIWSYAGDGDRSSVNSTFLQPFIAYTTKTYTTVTLNTESTYDWQGNQWTVPINLMASQLVKIDKLPVSFQLGGRYYAEGPSGGPEWGIRFVVTFLFPK